MHDCGHSELVKDCGGCDPGAVEFVITDAGERRAFDPAIDMATCPLRQRPAHDYRCGAWPDA